MVLHTFFTPSVVFLFRSLPSEQTGSAVGCFCQHSEVQRDPQGGLGAVRRGRLAARRRRRKWAGVWSRGSGRHGLGAARGAGGLQARALRTLRDVRPAPTRAGRGWGAGRLAGTGAWCAGDPCEQADGAAAMFRTRTVEPRRRLGPCYRVAAMSESVGTAWEPGACTRTPDGARGCAGLPRPWFGPFAEIELEALSCEQPRCPRRAPAAGLAPSHRAPKLLVVLPEPPRQCRARTTPTPGLSSLAAEGERCSGQGRGKGPGRRLLPQPRPCGPSALRAGALTDARP